jgi:serine/threonine-protein kinase HipA
MPRTLDVYLNRALLGNFVQDDHGEMSFSYGDTWLSGPDAHPLSHSLPLRKEPFSRRECAGFFAGILPEEDSRKIVASNLGISAQNDFAMLWEIGGECAGAVTFIPH